MAGKDEKNNGGGGTPPTPPEPTPDGGGSTPPAAPNYGEDIKSLKDTISKQGETIGQLQQYVGLSSTLINTIVADPELKERVQAATTGKTTVPTQQPNQGGAPNQNNNGTPNENPEYTRKVDDVVSSQRTAILKDFERAYGIDQLPNDDQKKVKQEIANYLGDFGWEVSEIPLTNLRTQLDKAYMGSVGFSKLREEGKLEGVIQARENAMGAIGGFSGGTPSTDQTGQLNPKQAEWVQKLRVDPEKAKKTYQEKETEKEREKPVK